MKNSTKKHAKDVAKIAAGAYIGSKLAQPKAPPTEYEDSSMAVVQGFYEKFIYDNPLSMSPVVARSLCWISALAAWITTWVFLGKETTMDQWPALPGIVAAIVGFLVYFLFPIIFYLGIVAVVIGFVIGIIYVVTSTGSCLGL